MPKSPRPILYTRPGCHLCEQASELLADHGMQPIKQDISGDLNLLRIYGARIPVLKRRDTDAELDWPFSQSALKAFLR